MISIITHNPNFFSKENLKFLLKKLSNKKRGPEIVLDSLSLGLKRIGYDFEIDKISPLSKKVHVISGVDALKWAIKEKQKGKINELIAGPNVVRHPFDDNSLLADSNIDKILVPSDWMAEYFSALEPKIKDRIYVWPAGTECNIMIPNTKRDTCLIFKKNTDENLFENIKKLLEEKKIVYEVIEYGKYNTEDYFKKLDMARFMIYLQTTESQGMALQEAWAHNVPTLVWNSISTSPLTGTKTYENVAAPYLTEESGYFFKDFDDFKNKLPKFIENLKNFKPKEYCKNNLSIEKSAKIYASIVDSNIKNWSKTKHESLNNNSGI